MAPESIEIRRVSSVDETRAMTDLLDRIWGQRMASPEFLRALATHENPVFGAFADGEPIGAQVGFLTLIDGAPALHSHATGVIPGRQHAGVGFRLKVAQRDWCLERDIGLMTWTFDPLIARNAFFNLRKLGCVAREFHRDFYGTMEDDINRGERSDRLEVRWELRSERVESALAGTPAVVQPGEAPALVDRDARAGERSETQRTFLIRVPSDYPSLKASDPRAARKWRDAVAEAFEWSFANGFAAVDFLRDGAYVLVRDAP
ncbi:MAG: hypothetical protein QOH26_519 [Actinomycetota bacterium]|jgi:predicted GNAT superfamily acetyltransferase|nr:hypothetical protein [Actinomycetota bacterium]